MSAHAPSVTGPRAAGARDDALARARPGVRAVGFAALALYGVERWSRLFAHPPGWRLFGLALEAIALAVGAPALRRATRRLPRPLARLIAAAAVAALVLALFPTAGIAWHTAWHLRIAVAVREVGDGLSALADVLVPYLGHDPATELVITLGAAVLLLDAAAVMAGAERVIGDGRRAAAAVPLIALAIVPATLVRPAHPALQGLILFALLALFVFGERIAPGRAGAGMIVVVLAGVGGAVAASHVINRTPWVDYRAWAGGPTATAVDAFDWSQTYGPLRWPQTGHEVLSVHARAGEYWKAQDLTSFDGTGWVAAPQLDAPALPGPSAALQRRYTHSFAVTIQGMTTAQVIGGSGQITAVRGVVGGLEPGDVPGTLQVRHPLGPGQVYTVTSYSPQPTAAQLAADTGPYPWAALAPDLTLTMPRRQTELDPTGSAPYAFAPFHHAPAADTSGDAMAVTDGGDAVSAVAASAPYRRAYALAQRMARGAATPIAFVRSVEHFLDSGSYLYNQAPPQSRYPLTEFLFHSKVGYCQQFSGAMAMLLRMGGVPARVAAGFTAGTEDRSDHTWAVSDIDAHAWVEVWFPRYGWVKFDPTPTSAPARGGTLAPSEERPIPAETLHPNQPLSTRKPAHEPSTNRSPSRAHATRATGAGGHGSSPWPWVATGAGVLLALAAAGLGRRRWRAHAATVDPVVELQRALRRSGRELRPQMTLIELERRLASSPQAAAYVHALRMERYGASAQPGTTTGRRALRRHLTAGLGLRGRLRGLWALPPRPRTHPLRRHRQVPRT